MSRCPECGMKECCGADMYQEIEHLRAEVERLKASARLPDYLLEQARELLSMRQPEGESGEWSEAAHSFASAFIAWHERQQQEGGR